MFRTFLILGLMLQASWASFQDAIAFDSLPDELVCSTLGHLNTFELIQASQVDRRFAECVKAYVAMGNPVTLSPRRLNQNRLSEVQFKALFSEPGPFSAAQVVRIDARSVCSECLKYLPKTIREFTLVGNPKEELSLNALSLSLIEMKELEFLHLEGLSPSEAEFSAIVEALNAHPTLKVLSLDFKGKGSLTVTLISLLKAQTGLETLDVTLETLDPEKMNDLWGVIGTLVSLESLQVGTSGNLVLEDPSFLAELKHLHTLSLRVPRGADLPIFFQTLGKLPQIKTLTLVGSWVSYKDLLSYLRGALQLEDLRIMDAEMTLDIAKDLVRALPRQGNLRHLSLAHNFLDDYKIKSFFRALRKVKSLQMIDLRKQEPLPLSKFNRELPFAVRY